MRAEANRQMLRTLAANGLSLESLARAAASTTTFSFVERDGTFFLETPNTAVPDKVLHDRTGSECFYNHVHHSTKDREEWSAVFDYLRGLRAALKTRYPTRQFRIIASSSGSELISRFHAVRVGEEWLNTNLESYTEEAIFVLNI